MLRPNAFGSEITQNNRLRGQGQSVRVWLGGNTSTAAPLTCIVHEDHHRNSEAAHGIQGHQTLARRLRRRRGLQGRAGRLCQLRVSPTSVRWWGGRAAAMQQPAPAVRRLVRLRGAAARVDSRDRGRPAQGRPFRPHWEAAPGREQVHAVALQCGRAAGACARCVCGPAASHSRPRR